MTSFLHDFAEGGEIPSTFKSTRWGFVAYEGQWPLFDTKPDCVKWWIWNHERCPSTGRDHYQGCLITMGQVRFSAIRKALPGVHLFVPRKWDALVNYCRKVDTRVDGGNHHHEDVPKQTVTMDAALIRVAQYRDRTLKFTTDNVDKWKELYQQEYDDAVGEILTEDSSLVGLYAQPIFRNAYVKWRKVWVSKADSAEETDRQTDRQTDAPA